MQVDLSGGLLVTTGCVMMMMMICCLALQNDVNGWDYDKNDFSPFTCDFIDHGGCDDDDTIDQAMRLTWAGLQVICYGAMEIIKGQEDDGVADICHNRPIWASLLRIYAHFLLISAVHGLMAE